jgi:uncharacterized protein YyaL (SSP411 family)
MANRLATETSPYLRQHADNPVDWHPWGDDAFALARAEDKPILLSVGYSACHWCHVMAHESFEDPDTAVLMNRLFVNVKVDREERPDVDAVYMEAVQAMTGHGGWPMTVFLTPDGRPFFGGTYFPKVQRGNMLSFTELCVRIDEVWRTRRAELEDQAGELTTAIGRTSVLAPQDDVPGPEVLSRAIQRLGQQFDSTWGGFGGAPKFPQTMSLELLLRHDASVPGGSPTSRAMVMTSLDAMATGGIYDHLGGGFARYATDNEWLVPHFEKMLYDQALLARVYLHAWQHTGDDRWRQVLDESVDYVLRDLRHPLGGFFSAEDADAEGEEGKFSVWSIDELHEVLDPLGADVAAATIEWFGATAAGNWEHHNILRRPLGAPLARPDTVETGRAALWAAREQRVRPGLDDKVLTEWNGLFLATLAEAAAATGNDTWLAAAVANAEFLCSRLRNDRGRWMRSWQGGPDGTDGQARHLAYAADYAALLDGFTRLAEATGEARWITEATAAAEGLADLFADTETAGVFTTGRDAEALVTRPKDLMDNATPSANSLAAMGLLRLAALTGRDDFEQRAVAILRLLAGPASQHPTAFANVLGALDLYLTGPTEIAVTGSRPDLVAAAARRYTPNAVIAWGEPFGGPLWEGRDAGPDGRGQAYVCRNFACQAPVTTIDAFVAQLA